MQKRVSKRALLFSALSLLLCVSMLVGSTFAWFSDTVTSGGNIIKSGKLDIDLGIKTSDDTDYVSVKANPDKKAFDYSLWEPGYTAWVNAKVSTTGNLALKYTLRIVPDGDVSALAEVIDVYYAASKIDQPNDRPDFASGAAQVAGLTKLGTLKQVLEGPITINDTLIPTPEAGETANTEDFATLVLHMQESAGNQYQDLDIGSTFSLQLLATQYTYEDDSFDDLYDENADGTPDNTAFPFDAASAAVVTDPDQALVLTAGNVSVTIPADAQEAGDRFELDNTEISLSAPDADGYKTLTLDISLKKNGVLVEQEDGLSYNLLVDLGKDLLLSAVTHNGEAVDPFTYDPATGLLSFATDSFSPFAFTYKETKVEVDTAEALQNALNDPELTEITLAEDLDLTGFDWEPIEDFAGTFDGNGKTITGLTIEGDPAVEGMTAMFNSVSDGAVIKDFKLEDVNVSGYYAAAVVADAEKTNNLTITNIEVASGTIHASRYASAIAFDVEGSNVVFTDCVNRATVTADYSASGIGAWVYPTGNSTVNNLANYGTITGGNRAGGIFGNWGGALLEDCENHGNVTSNGTGAAGGIVGIGGAATAISNCINDGDVTTTASNINASAAGILGQASGNGATTISYCINTGSITAENTYAGGITTSLYGKSTSKYCYNSGAVTGNNTIGNNPKYAAGGIAPRGAYGNGDKSQHCLNAGTVSANTNGATCNLTYQGITASYYYADGVLMTGANAEAGDLEAALADLNNGANEAFFGIENGVIKPLALIDNN